MEGEIYSLLHLFKYLYLILNARAVSNTFMDKRNQLIDIARTLFSERGYENTPLSLICETADVSKGLISHHFKSKDGLLREIFMQTTQMIVEMNTNSNPEKSAHEQLKDVLEAYFSQLESDKLFFQFNLNMIVQPNTRAVLIDLIKERSSFIFNATKTLFDEIDPTNSVVKSYLFIAELDGIALNYLGIFEDYPLQQMKQHVLSTYISE